MDAEVEGGADPGSEHFLAKLKSARTEFANEQSNRDSRNYHLGLSYSSN
jgi:hypothetical protein